MTSVKTSISKFAAMLAVAMLASLFCVGNAFAVSMDVTFTIPGTNTTTTQNVTLDQTGVQNSAAAPVVGMFYKANSADVFQWNVLVTGTAGGQYASFENVVTKAIQQYNTANNTSITYPQVWNANSNNVTFRVADNGGTTYTKYYPSYADTTSCNYFYDLATNSNTTLLNTLRSSSYDLTDTITGVNPNGVGAVFAWQYGSGITPSGQTAAAAAEDAAANITSSTYPRFIAGCSDGMTSSNAMGKRYCYDVIGITLS